MNELKKFDCFILGFITGGLLAIVIDIIFSYIF